MYVARITRVDILYGCCYLSQFANDKRCTQKVYDAAVRIAQFAECTADRGLDFTADFDPVSRFDGTLDLNMQAYSDSDHARQKLNRRSRTGGVILLEGMPLAHICQSQHGVAISSTEAEIVATSTVSQRVLGLKGQVDEVFSYMNKVAFEKLPKHVTVQLDMDYVVRLATPVPVFLDNDAARLIATAPNLSQKAKHIEIRFLACLDWYRRSIVNYLRVDTDDNLADIHTKPLPAVEKGKRKFDRLISKVMYTASG